MWAAVSISPYAGALQAHVSTCSPYAAVLELKNLLSDAALSWQDESSDALLSASQHALSAFLQRLMHCLQHRTTAQVYNTAPQCHGCSAGLATPLICLVAIGLGKPDDVNGLGKPDEVNMAVAERLRLRCTPRCEPLDIAAAAHKVFRVNEEGTMCTEEIVNNG